MSGCWPSTKTTRDQKVHQQLCDVCAYVQKKDPSKSKNNESVCTSSLYWHILGLHNSSPTLPQHKSSIQQAQDRVPLESPLREVDSIPQHSRAVVQEAPSCLKVNCCLLSVLHEMGGDSSQRCSEGRIQKATHKHAFDLLVGTHTHKESFLFKVNKYTIL